MAAFIRVALLLGLAMLLSSPASAQSTVVRETRKLAHRAGEALCTGTRADCAVRKVQHRASEAKDAVVDQAQALKDRVQR